ncbi:uncharacterized protein [Clytia hemisphaerica]|uniref:uncharacterized protein n=1 Tax=Clytia hemisphaerica TaxID=252671 RepID=UPI0034D5A25F
MNPNPVQDIIDPHIEVLQNHKNRISIGHLNTQSLLPSLGEFSIVVNKYNLDIYTISESWLQNNEKQISLAELEGYKLFYKNRVGKRGGGVAIYVKDTITRHERKDITKNHKDLEVVIVEAKGKNKNNSYLIVTVYQPSSKEEDKLLWLEKFDKLLADLNVKWNGPIFIAGDTNIDLLGEIKESTRRYKDILYSMNLKQHITKATRHGKTLIDHISSNISTKIIHTDVIHTDEVSDHDMPYVIVNIKKERFQPRYKYIRDEKNFDINSFTSDFQQLPLSLVFSFDDPNDQISILNKLVYDCIESHAPLKRVRITRPIAPWMKDPKIIQERQLLEDAHKWKIARVSPVPKIDHPTKLKDYRPISILPVLSKVYERVILTQLCDFIERNSLYRPNQSGFRKGHTTTTLLLKLRDDIIKAMNKSEITLSILIDYSKAFDTIDHFTLIDKLKKLNFSSMSLQIIISYLTNRQQFVQVNDKRSPVQPIHFGVPQGSILGPVLFNLYVTELSDQISSLSIQYADDTTLYRHSKIRDILQCIREIETDIESLSTWSADHNLLFNADKLQYIIFSTKRLASYHKLCSDYSYLISCSKKSIEQKDVVKLLGLHFDKSLSWSDHINQIIKSSHGTIRALRNFQRFTPFKVRKSLAEAIVLSKIAYSIVVFGQIPDYLLNRLQRIQNIAAGYVLNRYATLKDVVDLQWLPIKELIDFNVSKLVYKALNDKKWPSYLSLVKVTQPRKLRSQDDAPPSTIKYAKSRTNYYSNSTATFSIVLSGDIETNPGPTAPNNKPKCTVCSKTVGTNRKRFECEICFSMTHITCSEISKAQQKHYNAIKPYSWICSNCFCSELPFYKERELPIHKVMNPNPVQDIIDPHIEVLQNHKNRISIGHLNTQSLLPSLGEFSIVVNKYNLDIYTISESWLQNNEKQISLAELEGYKL